MTAQGYTSPTVASRSATKNRRLVSIRAADRRCATYEHGLGFQQVVKENVFTKDLDSFIRSKDVRKEYYPAADYPAATWVQIQRLFRPALVVEVEVTAVFPK